MGEVHTERQNKTIPEKLLKYHGLIRYPTTGLNKDYGCVICFKTVAGCKCTKRNPPQQLTYEVDSSCAACTRVLVDGEKTCETVQYNNPEYNSDCRKLELSGDQGGGVTRERIEAAIQLKLDIESGLLDPYEIDRLKNQHKTERRSCGVGIRPESTLAHHGIARIQAGYTSETLSFSYFCCFCYKKTHKGGCECVSRPTTTSMNVENFSSCSSCRLGIIDGVKQCWNKPGFEKCRELEHAVCGYRPSVRLVEYNNRIKSEIQDLMKQRKKTFEATKVMQLEKNSLNMNESENFEEESESESSSDEIISIEQDSQNNRIKAMPELLLWYHHLLRIEYQNVGAKHGSLTYKLYCFTCHKTLQSCKCCIRPFDEDPSELKFRKHKEPTPTKCAVCCLDLKEGRKACSKYAAGMKCKEYEKHSKKKNNLRLKTKEQLKKATEMRNKCNFKESDICALYEVKSEYENHEDAAFEQVHENNNAPEEGGVFGDESAFQDPLQRNSSISSSKKRSATQNEENFTPANLETQTTNTQFLKKQKTEESMKIDSDDDDCLIVDVKKGSKINEPVTTFKQEIFDRPTSSANQSKERLIRQLTPNLITPPLIESPLLNYDIAQNRTFSNTLNQQNLPIQNNLNFDFPYGNPSPINYGNLNPLANHQVQQPSIPANDFQHNRSSNERYEAEISRLKNINTELQQEVQVWKNCYFSEKNRKSQ